MAETLIIHTDGGSRGNPGPAGAAYVISNPAGTELECRGFFLGKTTNNVAEYTGMLRALQRAIELGAQKVQVFSDSELMVRQLNGHYKVKSENLKDLYAQCIEILLSFKSFKINHIRREKNTKADELANEAMDLERDVEYNSQDTARPAKKIRLAILLSGGGRTMVNIQDHIRTGSLNAEIVAVISSRSDVKGIERAKKIGLEPVIIRRKDFDDIESFSTRLCEVLDQAKVDLVIQAGWLCLWQIPKHYENRVMNIHPALLPSFGGKGMWGHHVHEAVLKAGCKISGCTVHFCNNEYDAGPIILQRSCPVLDSDDADTLAARVFQQECIAYPEAIKLFSEGKLKLKNGVVKIT